MSTHCGIAIKTNEGYKSIYCHQSGYPDYMWPMLTENYNSEELATKLVSFGDASYIEEKLEPTSDFHKFGMPEPGVSMFYHRDRGEDWNNTHPVTFTREELCGQFYYVYIWKDDCWNFYKCGRKTY